MPLTVTTATVAVWLRYRAAQPRMDAVALAMAAFTGYLWLSVAWTSSPKNGLFKAAGWTLGSFVIYLVIYGQYRVRPHRLWRMLSFVAVLGIVSLAVVSWASLGNGFGPGSRVARAHAITYQTPFQVYGLSNSLELGMIAASALALRAPRSIRRWWWVILAAVYFWGLIALSQRAQLLGASLACFILIAGRRGLGRAARHRPRIGGRSLLLATVGVVVLVGASAATAYKMSPTYILQDQNVSIRLSFYAWTVERFPERPLLGHGIGSFSQDRYGEDSRIFAHNIVLDTIYEGGAVGLVLSAAVAWQIFLLARRSWQSPWAGAGLGFVGLAFLCSRLVVGMLSADVSSLHIGPWMAMLAMTRFHTRENAGSEGRAT